MKEHTEEKGARMSTEDKGATDLKHYLDSEYPLMAKFKSAAPGTFRHSQNVANLAEAVASELDLDPVLMKVCATYHDIGKMLNPTFYTENQTDGHNIHDDLDARTSYQFITRHVSDSLMILMTESDLPTQVLSIISKHHGDSVLAAIFAKAGEGAEKDAYRYKTPKPDCEYSSILMIVDAVEATARSMQDKMNSPEARIDVVRMTIDRLRDDQQLDEMRVGVLRQVQQKLVRELDGIYHSRLDYAEDDKKKSK